MSDSVVKPGAIVRCVDHIAIRASDTKYLFSLFSETFQLPIVLPMARYGITSSGVVFAGNVNIEVLQFNATKEEKKAKPGSAKFFLSKNNLLEGEAGGEIKINPARIEGLDVRLAE